MSKFSTIFHSVVDALKGVLGTAVTHDAGEVLADEADKFKAVVQAAAKSFLENKLGTVLGDAVYEGIAYTAINAAVTAVEALAVKV